MDWQPIETAPKDETAILICHMVGDHAFYNVVYWNDTDLGTPEHPWCFVECGGRCAAPAAYPQYWAPLKPPTPAATGRDE
jgi:hypothetical protein